MNQFVRDTKLNLGILYNITSRPWGGVNSFFRNFQRYAQTDKRVIISAKLSEADIILTVGHYSGPGIMMRKWQLKNVSRGFSLNNFLGKFSGKGKKKLTFRLDGLRRIYAPEAGRLDEPLIKNLPLADSVIFQSKYSRNSFIKENITYPKHQDIIINGANFENFFPNKEIELDSNKINLVSNSWSNNHKKGFKTIARFSKIDRVKVSHIGNWPNDISPEKVRLLGTMNEERIGHVLRGANFLLFPSENEACSNVVIEALASGLPVLYHNSGGTPELCQNNNFGLPLPENIQDLNINRRFLDEAVDSHATMRAQILGRISSFNFRICYEKYIEHFQTLV